VELGQFSNANSFVLVLPGTTYVFKKKIWVVVYGINCSKYVFEKFFGPKKGDLVTE
jgi:hypothetical protein